MDLSDDEVRQGPEADRREVDPPAQVETATWSRAGQLDWWVKERREWWVGYVPGAVPSGLGVVVGALPTGSRSSGNRQPSEPGVVHDHIRLGQHEIGAIPRRPENWSNWAGTHGYFMNSSIYLFSRYFAHIELLRTNLGLNLSRGRTLTWDQGNEMFQHHRIEKRPRRLIR
jgi:hypothetical protein